MDDENTVAECLRCDGFDNVDECGFTLQEYMTLLMARFDCDDSERLCSFFQGMSRLSDRAKAVVRLVLNPPGELLMLIISRKTNRPKALTQNAIRRYLVQLCSWKIYEVEKAFGEIKKSLEKF